MRGESLAYKLLRLHKRRSVDVLNSEQYVGFLGAYTSRIVSALVAFLRGSAIKSGTQREQEKIWYTLISPVICYVKYRIPISRHPP